MARNYPDFIKAFIDYASFSEAPPKMHFWSAVSTIAGALRRKVWFEQYYFRWYPNFYIIFVAPPGVVAKSTTMDIGMKLLREIPGIKFGASVVTWPALVKGFSECREAFQLPNDATGELHEMSCMTIASSEFGNLLNPQDKEMVDMLTNLWDGVGFRKETKFSGNDDVVNPWLNIIACTTPSWIAGNFPEYMIGGGFTSRAVFVYTEKKHKLVAYPGLHVPAGIEEQKQKLIQDLEHISVMVGEYKPTKDAYAWGQEWYEHHNTHRPKNMDDDRFGGYIARKQSHLHKLAMVLAASQRDDMVITREDLSVADTMVSDLEGEMFKVFSKIGLGEVSIATERMVEFVRRRGNCSWVELYRFVHNLFPSLKEYEDIIAGLIKAGIFELRQQGSSYQVFYLAQAGEAGPLPPSVGMPQAAS